MRGQAAGEEPLFVVNQQDGMISLQTISVICEQATKVAQSMMPFKKVKSSKAFAIGCDECISIVEDDRWNRPCVTGNHRRAQLRWTVLWSTDAPHPLSDSALVARTNLRRKNSVFIESSVNRNFRKSSQP